jgi:hypothetical protein
MNTLFDIWNNIQSNLFPWLEEELDPLTEKEKQFVSIISLLDLSKHLRHYAWCGIGRKRKSRLNLAKAFVAKAVYNFEPTDILIEYLKGCKNLRRLCGWETRSSVPSKSTFSRAFGDFAEKQLPNKIHEAIIYNNPRCRGEKIQMDPATKIRYAQRSSAERVNSTLKDNYGGRNIRVEGSQKIMTHLMFGVLTIMALQLYRLLL